MTLLGSLNAIRGQCLVETTTRHILDLPPSYNLPKSSHDANPPQPTRNYPTIQAQALTGPQCVRIRNPAIP